MENTNRPFVTRFCPTPTGPLHLGHAYALKVANTLALRSGGHMVLRIDDLYNPNISQTATNLVYDVLRTLRLKYTQSSDETQRRIYHEKAVHTLRQKGLLYASEFTEDEAISFFQAPHNPPWRPDEDLTLEEIKHNIKTITPPSTVVVKNPSKHMPVSVWRLNIKKAANFLRWDHVTWFDYNIGMQQLDVEIFPDIVVEVRRYGVLTQLNYHIAVVVDDHLDGVNLVTRGKDLLAYTPLQVLLQQILQLKSPDYYHHELIKDSQGNRLAKRNDALSVDTLLKQHGVRPVFRDMLPLVDIKDFIKG